MSMKLVWSRFERHGAAIHTLSATLFSLAAGLAVVGALGGWEPPRIAAAVALTGFVLIEARHIPRMQMIAGLVLLAVGAVMAGGLPQVLTAFAQGILRTLPFMLIFASVGWLRSAASESPSMVSLRHGLARLGAGWRFAALSLSSHLIGSGFNLAGIGLLVPMLDAPAAGDAANTARDGVRLRCAILWGFGAATCWSPFFVGTAAILAVMPAVTWTQVAPYGLLLAMAFLLYGMMFNRYLRGARNAAAPLPEAASALLLRPALRLAGALGLLYALTLTAIEVGDLPLTTAIALTAPIFALVWLFLIHGRREPRRIAPLIATVFHGYPAMRTETALFICANVFGVAINMLLQRLGMTDTDVTWLSTGSVFLNCLFGIWTYLAICALGIHPIVVLVVFSSIVDPATLGLPIPLLTVMLMALWGMGTSVSPLSGTTLLMAQLSGTSSFRVGWRWNGTFYALAAVWLAAAVSLAA